MSSRYGRTALHWAAEHGHKEVAELLIDYGADVDCRDLHCLRTPLHWASKYGHFNIVKHLLRKGKNTYVYQQQPPPFFPFPPSFATTPVSKLVSDRRQ